jgi:hypothetical protein
VTLAPKGLLIEEQRTNLFLYSEQFNDATWAKTNATITANTTVAPSGSTTAETFAVTSAGTQSRIHVVPSGLSGTNTISIFAKADTKTVIQVCDNNSATAFVNFDLSGGAVGSTGGGATGVITALANGWYRCAATFTWASEISFHVVDSSTSARREAPATTGALFIWGAQAENGAFSTSYIPTVASQVTRAADNASMIGNNFARWYNVNEGTLFAQYDFAGYSAFNPIFDIGTDQNNLISLSLNSVVNSRFVVVSGGTTQANIAVGLATANTVYKQAGAYKLDDFATTRNGATPATDTSGTVPAVSQAAIGGTIGLTRSLNGHVYRIAYYNRRLANTELTAITS